jgi:hypothetical protein
MRFTLALAAAIAAVALAAPAHAEARSAHHTRDCPSAAEINRMAAAGANMVPGFAQYLESCIVHRRIRRAFKACVTEFGIGAIIGGVGSIIAQATARAAAGAILSTGAGGCINALRGL